jgi:hypothetical protein
MSTTSMNPPPLNRPAAEAAPAASATGQDDWTTDAADAIERAVALVRERTVEPAQTATKLAIYGVLAALIAIPALILMVIGLFRGLVLAYQGEVWAAWLTLGGIFVILGALLFARRHS